MPPHLQILNDDGSPATAIDLSIFSGTDSDAFVYEIWNDKEDAFGDTTTAFDFIVTLLASAAGGPFKTAGIPILDERWCRLRITARLTATFESTEWATGTLPLGTNAEFPMPDLPPQEGFRVELHVLPPGGMLADGVAIELRAAGNSASTALSRFTGLATGSAILPPDRQPGLRSITRGSVLAADDSDTVTVSNGQLVYDGTTVTFAGEDVTFTLADSAAVNLGVGESYRATLSRDAAGVLSATKGAEGVTLSYPDKPADDVFVAFLTVRSDDGVAVAVDPAGVIQAGMRYAGYAVRAGVGRGIIVSPGDAISSTDLRQYLSHEISVNVADDDVSRVWLLPGGGISTTLDDAEPTPGAGLIAIVTAAAGAITALVDARRFAHRSVTEWSVPLRHRGVLADVAIPAMAWTSGFSRRRELEAVTVDLTGTDPTWTDDGILIDIRAYPPGAAVPYPDGGAGGTSIYTDDSQRPFIAFDATMLRVTSEDHIARRFPAGTRFLLGLLGTVDRRGKPSPRKNYAGDALPALPIARIIRAKEPHMNLANIFKYLAYIQLIPALISFITQAEASFGKGKGTEKAAAVLPKFTQLVDALAITGLIKANVANSLKAGAQIIIDTLVAVLNATGVLPKMAEEIQTTDTTAGAE